MATMNTGSCLYIASSKLINSEGIDTLGAGLTKSAHREKSSNSYVRTFMQQTNKSLAHEFVHLFHDSGSLSIHTNPTPLLTTIFKPLW